MIGLQELATVVFGCAAFGEALRGKVVQVDCDNEGDVGIVNGGAGRTPAYNCLLRELHGLSVQFGFELRAVHVPGVENVLADALSRGNHAEFLALTPFPLHELREVQVPESTRTCLLRALSSR